MAARTIRYDIENITDEVIIVDGEEFQRIPCAFPENAGKYTDDFRRVNGGYNASAGQLVRGGFRVKAATPSYEQLRADAADREAALEAHVLTEAELERIHPADQAIATGERDLPKGPSSYAVGGYFRDKDCAVLSQTRRRNVQRSEVRLALVEYALREDTVLVEYWAEAF